MTKKIDLYCDGNCWDPKYWSGTPLELATTMKKMGSLKNIYNVHPFKYENSLSHYLYYSPFVRIDKQGIYSTRYFSSSYLEKRQKIALKMYESNTKPDSIITIWHLAVFNKTPYFTLNDIDLNMIIKWREEKKTTYLSHWDRVPIPLIKKTAKFEREVYENAAGIFVPSEWIKNSICSYINDSKKVAVTGIGHRYSTIQLSEEILTKRFENPVLLFVGKDGIRKGVDIVIKAYRQVKSDLKNIKLKIVTNLDKLPAQTKMLIKDLPDVELYNSVEPEKLTEMYQNASLFVMPSRFEPFGKVFFEAMSFGLPVIGGNSCAMPEFIIDSYNGYTPLANSEEVAEKIKEIFNSYERYKYFSKNAINVSNKYKEENVVKNMISIIDKYS